MNKFLRRKLRQIYQVLSLLLTVLESNYCFLVVPFILFACSYYYVLSVYMHYIDELRSCNRIAHSISEYLFCFTGLEFGEVKPEDTNCSPGERLYW